VLVVTIEKNDNRLAIQKREGIAVGQLRKTRTAKEKASAKKKHPFA